jgi:hypothetical protein
MVVIRVMLALYVNYSNYSKNNVVLDNVRRGAGIANFGGVSSPDRVLPRKPQGCQMN